MEIARMNYYFTGALIILFVLLCFMQPAYPKNEYLNEYGVRCGEMEFRVEDRNNTQDYHTYNSSDYDNNSKNFSVTYRKYLGTDCKTSKENVAIKQQLELMKMCGRVNSNPSLAHNENFRLLVSKCRGVTPTGDNTRPTDSQSLWDDMKDDYKKENPDIQLMGNKFINSGKTKLDKPGLKIPPKDYILPLPKPKENE
jgi:hypothetical protein|tara:strand:- start:379 stop:969 length:591 start_codon:yes stop_codon:yes gene_type:complete